MIQGRIVDIRIILSQIRFSTFLFGQKFLCDEFLQVDEIRISGKGGKGLIGGIPIAGRSDGKDLPVGLT